MLCHHAPCRLTHSIVSKEYFNKFTAMNSILNSFPMNSYLSFSLCMLYNNLLKGDFEGLPHGCDHLPSPFKLILLGESFPRISPLPLTDLNVANIFLVVPSLGVVSWVWISTVFWDTPLLFSSRMWHTFLPGDVHCLPPSVLIPCTFPDLDTFPSNIST